MKASGVVAILGLIVALGYTSHKRQEAVDEAAAYAAMLESHGQQCLYTPETKTVTCTRLKTPPQYSVEMLPNTPGLDGNDEGYAERDEF